MKNEGDIKKIISDLLKNQKLGVLSTCSGEHVHASLIAFSALNDFKKIYFFSPRGTRKFQFLTENPHVCLLIDNRSNRDEDFHAAAAVGIYGSVAEIDKEICNKEVESFLEKNPALKEFTKLDSSALLEINVERYSVVREFQKVVDIIIDE